MFDYPNSFFILTSRPKGYNEGYSSEHKPNATLYIKKFNQNQIENFVYNWYLCQESFARGGQKTPYVIQEVERKTENLLQQLEERKELEDLATNPLLLNMIANIHRFYPSEKLPQRRTELYQEIFKLQLGDRPLFRQIEMLLSATDSQQILQEIALLMVQVNQTTLEYDELEALVQNAINSLDESVNCQKFIKQIEEVSELLIKRDDYYEFAHLSFQNYLAAKEIQRTNQENLILTHWPDSDIWKETTRLYVAQLRNPSNFIRRLIEDNNPEAITLAYQCLKETSRQIDFDIDEESQLLSSTVQNARYPKLEQLLKNRQFKEADHETYKLMLETVGKEEGQYFDPGDFETFPCEELVCIDNLWSKYSQGKFGFSIQTKIWQEYGSPTLYDHNNSNWISFCHRIGWMKDRQYVKYKDFYWILEQKTPTGHLPNDGCGGLGNLAFYFYYLASRLMTCKTLP